MKMSHAFAYMSLFCILLTLLMTTLSIKAGTFRDDFEEFNDADWNYPNRQIWHADNGFLHVNQPVWKGEGKPMMPITYFLQFTAFPGPHEQFTITVANIRTTGSGGFGIALGRSFPDILWHDIPSFYVFKTQRITARQFRPNDSGGGVGPFVWIPGGNRSAWPRESPDTIWGTWELKEIELGFNAGRFQMFADGDLRADFVDLHFGKIQLIGFLLMGNMEWGGSQGWADSFTISAPSVLSIELHDKLTAMWGNIRHSK